MPHRMTGSCASWVPALLDCSRWDSPNCPEIFIVPEFLGSKLWEAKMIDPWLLKFRGQQISQVVFQLITSGGLSLGSVGIELDLRLGHFLSKDQMSWDRG